MKIEAGRSVSLMKSVSNSAAPSGGNLSGNLSHCTVTDLGGAVKNHHSEADTYQVRIWVTNPEQSILLRLTTNNPQSVLNARWIDRMSLHAGPDLTIGTVGHWSMAHGYLGAH